MWYSVSMFDSFSEKLREIIGKTSGGELTQDNMQEAFREIRRALLDADVNLRVVKGFISNIKDKAEGEKIVEGVNPSQQLVKIVHDELVELLGHENKPLDFSGNPNLIMMLGLQGSGKTTSSAKLAVKLKKEGRNPLLVACDVYRPAAISQLQTLGKEIENEVFTIPDCTDVQRIVREAIDYAGQNGFNTLILDTAGRLQIDTDMMAELLLIDRIFKPSEKLLVIDSMTGQEAVNVAENFDAQLELTGLVLTKLDGDTRGEIKSDNYETFFELGVCHLLEENICGAIKNFVRAIQINPDNPDAILQLGLSHELCEEYDLALMIYQKLIENSPEFIKAYEHKSALLMKLERFQEAATVLYHLIKINPNYHKAFAGLGVCLDKLGKKVEAQRFYRRFLNAKPVSFNSEFIKKRFNKIKTQKVTTSYMTLCK